MDGKPAPERAGEREPEPEQRPTAAETGQADGHYGPLELTRLRKDDGRALLVFARSAGAEGRPEPPAGAEGRPEREAGR
jgi:hypothetical protein